ncbi:dipeptidyl peptidase 2-like, partial [Saccoglossus kowalevskii]|uniref:Dipeptidyl peptidase 2-like n=1 Tax=Saccoglossus kowalevskii TaxID=10224 RepID=A0ABM0MSY1_SACKO
RYYGKSLPFGDSSFILGNIGFLSIEQAMADYAVLIHYLKIKLNAAKCPVIAFGGLQKLTKILRLCKPMTKDRLNHVNGWIRNSLTNLAMFDYPYPTTFLVPVPAYPVKVACSYIMNSSDPLVGLVQAAGLYYNGTKGSLKCFDVDTEFVECADPTGCGVGPDSMAWDYQACTESMMPAGSNGKTDMFPDLPFTLKMRDEYCEKKWNIVPRNDWLNVHLWGKDILTASNIVFANGSLDPWRRGGVLSSLSDSLIAVLIDGGAHHLDLRGANPLDPQSVLNARQEEVKYIQKWIEQF